MKKFFICILTCLLFLQVGLINIFADEARVYTPDDFDFEKVIHFKAGDKIAFNDEDFDLYIYGKNDVELENIKEYTFENDLSASIYNFSLEDDKFINLRETYTITFDLRGKGDNFIDYSKYYLDKKFYAALPAVPTATNYMFEYWCIDEELEKPIYYNDKTKERYWDVDGEYEITGDTTLYAKWAEVQLMCIEVKGPSETKPQESIELKIIPIADNERIYDVSVFEPEDRPVINAYISGLMGIRTITYDEERKGYFYEFTPSSIENEYIINFSIKDKTISTQYVVNSYNVNSNETLENDGWPWGTDFSIDGDKYSVKLNTKLISDDITNLKYQWQVSSDNVNYVDITSANDNTHIVEVQDCASFDNCWFRCFITYTKDSDNYTCISKAVKIIDSRLLNSNLSTQYGSLFNSGSRNIEGTLDGLYISNDLGAYCIGSNGKNQYFNVLGKYNNGIKNYWVSASYDAAWALYFKNNDGFVSNNIDSIVCNFDDGTSNVNLDFKFKNKADVALYTDLCVGRFPEIYYADGAALKSNLDSNNNLDSIHIVTNSSFGSASLEDNAGFVFKPQTKVDAFNIDALINGPHRDKKMGRYQYISNDYSNNDDPTPLSYEDVFNELQSRLYDFNYGIVSPTFSGNDPFVFRTINGKKIVVAMYGKDSVMSCAWNDVDNIKFSMNIGNAIDLGIDHTDIRNIKPTPTPKTNIEFIIPKTGIN